MQFDNEKIKFHRFIHCQKRNTSQSDCLCIFRWFYYMEEVWKDIIGFESSYQISNFGRVKSLDRYVWNKANKSYSLLRGKIHKLDIKNKLYYQIGIWENSKIKKYLIHRLVAIHFVENRNNLPEVNHIDCDKLNNNYTNLEWCSHLENQHHAKINGRYSNHPNGVNKINSILNDNAIIHIRSMQLRNIDYCNLYNVKPSTITCIQKDLNRWKHVK